MFLRALYQNCRGVGNKASVTGFIQPTSQARTINFFQGWLNRIFNSVDKERLKLVGPDRACAEWLLRNGATVRFKGHTTFVSDYNALIGLEGLPESDRFRVEEIYAEDAGISQVGFEHFRNCNHIKKITFIKCHYLDDKAMYNLRHTSETLKHLEVNSCFAVDDKGILWLTHLRNLTTLILKNLPTVEKKDECELALRKALPKCEIDYQP